MSSRSKRTLALSMAALLCVGIPGALDDRVAVGAVPSPRTVEKVKVIDGNSLSIPELAEFEGSIRTPGQPLLPEVRAWLHENAPSHDGETEYDPDASFFGLRVSELEDSASLVDEEITTLADAARDVKTANEIGSFVAELPPAPLADNSEAGLVGWGLDTNTGANAWIVWNGPMPASIENQLQDLVVGTIDVYESNFSLLDIRSVADVLHAQALASTDANFARSDIDVRTASIIVTTEVGPPLVADSLGFGFEHRIDDELTVSLSDANARGGAGIGGCTTSFILRRSNGQKAVGTAGHCASNGTRQAYRNHPVDGTAGYWLYNPISYYLSGYDLGYFPVGTQLTPLQTFYYDLDAKRYVEDVGIAGTDVPIWVYGHASMDRFSMRTRTAWTSCTVQGVTVVALTTSDRHRIDYGDSGGPWSIGDVAYGVTYGWCGGVDVYTPVGIYPTAGPFSVWER